MAKTPTISEFLIAISKKVRDAYGIEGKTVGEYMQMALSADFVPVVRCRECYFGKGELICSNPKCTKSFYGCPVPPEHFCSYGERKDNGSA